jgi:hypothetical protein
MAQSISFTVLSKPKNLNVCFEDGATLMNVMILPREIKLLIQFGFTAFNQQDHVGEHSIFALANFLDSQLFQLCVDKGADINLKNYKSHTVLRRVIDRLSMPSENEIKMLLDSLNTLLSGGDDITLVDYCTCACFPGGCLPVSGLKLEVQALLSTTINNQFWIFEWLFILEEHGKLIGAKAHALSVLRRAKFDETGLRHTCCQNGMGTDMDSNEPPSKA